MAPDRQASCEERIGAHLASRLADFRSLAKAANHEIDENAVGMGFDPDPENVDEDQVYSRWSEYPLGVSVSKLYRIDLSTGGPGDWLEIHVDNESWEISRIEYHFNDWFDHAQRTLAGPEFDDAEAFARQFIYET